jgi:hypothetical protein
VSRSALEYALIRQRDEGAGRRPVECPSTLATNALKWPKLPSMLLERCCCVLFGRGPFEIHVSRRVNGTRLSTIELLVKANSRGIALPSSFIHVRAGAKPDSARDS